METPAVPELPAPKVVREPAPAAPAPPPTVVEVPAPTRSRSERQPVNLGQALAAAFLTNERINQVLLDAVNPRIWRMYPPSSRGRNIATSFAHIHNVRCMRIKMSARSVAAPEPLDRAAVSIDEVRWSLGSSARAMVSLIEEGLLDGGHVRGDQPDVIAMACAAITHEAHHRGQICHWLRELGTPLTPEQQLTMWEWDKRAREVRYPFESR
ncbi:MAG: DinB family protein [Gemmatimonadaceae bacterium]